MSIVIGTVEATSTKFGKFSIMVDGVWYGTKQEWAPSPLPEKGDSVEFDDGGSKFLKKLKVKSKSESKTFAGGQKKTYNSLGVELGHAANLGMQVTMKAFEATTGGIPDEEMFWREFSRNTDIVFDIMKAKRNSYENATEESAKEAERIQKVENKLSGSKPEAEDALF